jgi:hypothetical protein
MIIGGAAIALVESRHNSMHCEAYPSRLAMVLDVLNNGALGGGIGHGCDEHKAALAQVATHIATVQAQIEQRERRDAEIDAAREPWIAKATAYYVETGTMETDDAKRAASSLFSMYVHDSDGALPDPELAAAEDMASWDQLV